MERVYWCGDESRGYEVPDHQITWAEGILADDDELEWWEKPPEGEA